MALLMFVFKTFWLANEFLNIGKSKMMLFHDWIKNINQRIKKIFTFDQVDEVIKFILQKVLTIGNTRKVWKNLKI